MDNYYGIFTPDGDGWIVRFPDVPGALTEGDTVEESLKMAVDALSSILANGHKGRDYFEPRSYAEISKEKEGNEVIMPVSPSKAIMDEYRLKNAFI